VPKRNGFSLIELLIVVAIILIIAAIAIPNLLQARIAANEASAASTLRTIKTAEYGYYTAYPDIGYATSIAELGGAPPCTPSSTTACLVDGSVASAIAGSNGKSGYIYAATGINSGASFNSAFVAGTAPVVLNRTGNRNFCSTNDGVLRSQYGAGGLPVNTVAACLAYQVAQ
jgi:type IV pilus assembly protein PilA